MSIELTGKVMGSVRTHTEETLKKVFDKAYTVIQLPEGELYEGELDQLKGEIPKRPIVLFMHGSSGINPAIRTFARHLAQNGLCFLGTRLHADSRQNHLFFTGCTNCVRRNPCHALRRTSLCGPKIGNSVFL